MEAARKLLYTDIEAPESRISLPSSISKDAVLQKLHDVSFMVSCSPTASLPPASDQASAAAPLPSDWLRTTAEETHATTPNTLGPVKYYTMIERNPLGDWAPGLPYSTASVNYPDGYKSIVHASLGTRLQMAVEVVRTAGGDGWELVENMNGSVPMGMGSQVKKTFLKAHAEMMGKMIKKIEEEQEDQR